MNGMLGMDTTTGAQVARTVQGLSGSLEIIEQQVALARLMSLSPLNWGLLPGAGVLSPASIQMGAQVTRELANVQQTLAYMATKLAQEAQQQEQVSNSLTPNDPGWFAPGPTVRRPDEIGLWEEEWDLLGGWGEGLEEFFGVVGDVWGTLTDIEFWIGIGDNIQQSIRSIDLWWNQMLDSGPRWLRPALEFVWDALDRWGKFLPWVGIAFTGINLFVDWDWDNPWGNGRNLIALGLDIVSFIPTPWTVAIGAIGGLIWDVVDSEWDRWEENDGWVWWWDED